MMMMMVSCTVFHLLYFIGTGLLTLQATLHNYVIGIMFRISRKLVD